MPHPYYSSLIVSVIPYLSDNFDEGTGKNFWDYGASVVTVILINGAKPWK